MRTGITRRSAISALGASAGFGATSVLGGCGGGGSGDGGDAGPGGNGGSGTLPGSFWYQRSDGNLYVSAGGTSEPVIVNKVLGVDAFSKFAISRAGPRYLQVSHVSGAATSDIRAVINVYEHASHQAYCFINLAGYVRAAAVSPSGRYVAAMRSPEFAYSVFNEGSTFAIVDLMIIDISDVNSIRDIRNSRTDNQSTVYGFQWLADDRFVYMTWGDGNFGDSMYSGSAAAGSAGDQLLGKIDKQGLRIGAFNVHPDESTMLLSMFDRDGHSLGVWDVYSYSLNGQPIDRVTAVDQGYGGVWSPGGEYIFFKYGNGAICADSGCVATCSSRYIPSTLRSASLSTAALLDEAKVPCTWGTHWRS